MKKRKNSKSSRRKISLFKITALLLLIISILFMILLYKIDILPFYQFCTILTGVFVVDLIFGTLLMRKKTKKAIRGFFVFLSFIVIGVMSYVSYNLLNTMGFLTNIQDDGYKTENYSVVVLKNSKCSKLIDIKGKEIGYYNNSDGANKANKRLTKIVNVKLNKYDDSTIIKDELLSNKVGAILIEDSILSMIKEENPDFENLTKVIYHFSIKIKVKNSAKDVNVTQDAFNIYISGIDTYGKISSVSRSDVNMIVSVNSKTKQVLLTSIPRDYYVKLHGVNGINDKLTHAGMYGVDMSIGTIEDLLGIEINYYIKVNFTSLIEIVDSLGGVNVYSDYTFNSIDGKHFTKGNNALNGEQALSFARERKAFSDGDRQRGRNQQAVIAAIISKVCSKQILTKYTSLLNSLEDKFQTNMKSSKITSLIKMQLKDMSAWNVSTYGLEGVDSRNYTYSAGNSLLYVMEPVTGSIQQAKELITQVINGKKLESSYTYDGPINTVTTIPAPSQSEKKSDNKSTTETVTNTKKTVPYEYPLYKCSNPLNGICEIEKDDKDNIKEPTCELSTGFIDGELNCSVGGDDKKDGTLVCDDGYKLNDNQCIKTVVEKVNICKPGYDYQSSGQVCCLSGYKYDDKEKLCVSN